MRRSRVKAWLITWDWCGDHAAMPDKVVCILNSRTSPDRVREIVELLYANAKYNLSERLNYARRRFNPYPAQFGALNGVPWEGQIICGHNPYLYARMVEDLRIELDADGKEQLTWCEVARPRLRGLPEEMAGAADTSNDLDSLETQALSEPR